MADKYFIELMDKLKTTHIEKNHDYANALDPHSNFKFVSDFLQLMDGVPTWCVPYLALMGVKLARLKELLIGKEPKNESVADSFLDLTAYCGLWAARYASDNQVSKCRICDKQIPSDKFYCSLECYNKISGQTALKG